MRQYDYERKGPRFTDSIRINKVMDANGSRLVIGIKNNNINWKRPKIASMYFYADELDSIIEALQQAKQELLEDAKIAGYKG